MSGDKHWSKYARKYEPIAVGSIDGTDKEPHDNGIVRAINSEYTPNAGDGGNAKCTVFVARLHPRIDDNELKELFKEYGRIKQCTVIRDIVTGHSKQYGFVEFEKESHAGKAYRMAHKSLVHGAAITVDKAFGTTMKGWKPRRLGGGFGGKKETGQIRFGCRERPWHQPIGLHLTAAKYQDK